MLHLQRVDSPEVEGSKIQVTVAPSVPTLEFAAEGYEPLARLGSGPTARLDYESRWHELMISALTVPDREIFLARFHAEPSG